MAGKRPTFAPVTCRGKFSSRVRSQRLLASHFPQPRVLCKVASDAVTIIACLY